MEPILENVYTDTVELMREQYAYGGKTHRIIFLILYVLLLIDSVWGILYSGYWLYWVPAVLSVSYILYFLLWPGHRAKKYMEAHRKLYDGEMPQTTVRFYENEVAVQMGRESFSIPYEKVTKIIALKHSISLVVEKAASISVSPNHFTKGSIEEMYRFLRVKCPGVKLPGWNW